VTDELAIKVTRRAASEIAGATEWWQANRPAAPRVLPEEIERAFHLVAFQPGIGARAVNTKLAGVRRLHLSRIRYHLYYRVASDGGAVEILALWHTSRRTGPGV
jgi:plasmid stabilization system protein ParE